MIRPEKTKQKNPQTVTEDMTLLNTGLLFKAGFYLQFYVFNQSQI